MSFKYKLDTNSGNILFRRSPFDRNLSALIALLACIFLTLGLTLGYNLIGIIQSLFGFGMLALAFAILREYLLIPPFMYFDNEQKSFKLGSKQNFSEIPYSAIRKIDVGEEIHTERNSTNYYVFACLGSGGRWHLQGFGNNREKAQEFCDKLRAQVQLGQTPTPKNTLKSPTINQVHNTDGSVLFKWHSKEHVRYSFLLLLFVPFFFTFKQLLADFPPNQQIAIASFALFVTVVALIKIGLGLLTWHFIEVRPEGLEYGLLVRGNRKRVRSFQFKEVTNFFLNYIPSSPLPALRGKLCYLTNEFNFVGEDANYSTLKKVLETGEGNGIDLIDVESLELTERIDLYFYIRQYINPKD